MPRASATRASITAWGERRERGYGFLCLAGESTELRDIPLTDDGNSLSLSFAYVPAGRGMPARLVAEPNGTYPGWTPVFSDLAAETTRGPSPASRRNAMAETNLI